MHYAWDGTALPITATHAQREYLPHHLRAASTRWHQPALPWHGASRTLLLWLADVCGCSKGCREQYQCYHPCVWHAGSALHASCRGDVQGVLRWLLDYHKAMFFIAGAYFTVANVSQSARFAAAFPR